MRLGSLTLLLLLHWTGCIGMACSIPVFRYALDKWAADAFILEVPLSVIREPAFAAEARKFGDDGPLNLTVRVNDQAAPDAPARLLHAEKSGERVCWTGAMDAEALIALGASPASKALVDRMLAGHSAVWVMVEGSDPAANTELRTRLEKRLKYLESIAQLPRIDPNDPSSRLGPGPKLAIQFSVLTVRADDPAERLFLTLLAGPHAADLLKAGDSREPFAAPVFGRGRVLLAAPASDLDEAAIEDACLFLLGACSCQVKAKNPGWDLLLRVRWDEALKRVDAVVTTP